MGSSKSKEKEKDNTDAAQSHQQQRTNFGTSTTYSSFNSSLAFNSSFSPPSPVNRNTVSPVQSSTVSPVQSSTASPVQSSTASPVQSSTASPVQSSTASPVQSSTASPVQRNIPPSRLINTIICSPPPQPKAPVPPNRVTSSGITSQPKVPDVGNQIVKYSVNNYIIPKGQTVVINEGARINVPYRKFADKFLLRVCPHYNSKVGCHAVVCRRFHVCFYWVQGKCQKTSCEYDHMYSDHHNQIIINALKSRRDNSLDMVMETLKNNHKFNKRTKRDEPVSICMFSIMKRCNKKECSLRHAYSSYVWEVKDNDMWLELGHEQSKTLEKLYCQPDQNVVDLPPVPKIGALQKLRSVLIQSTKWEVAFDTMELYSDKATHDVRRLSTPSDICCMNRLATRWLWYWQDDSGLWSPYTDGCGAKFYVFALSDQLEYHYNFNSDSKFEVTLGSYTYVIDVTSMTQLNKETGKVRNVRRRPCYMTKNYDREEEISFDQYFSLNSNEQKMRNVLSPVSSEFIFVRGMMQESMPSIKLLSVERVVNNHLWKAFQNKKDLLKMLYSNDIAVINEQYLFHGTKHSVIDQICNDNFDWRLYGTNVGNVYGHGVYFSNVARLSDSYSRSNDAGDKVMFVVIVLVGTMTIGNSSMKFPPQNPVTGRCFDTTCDDQHSSRIFVKYNRDEYYPAYIVHYQP